MNPLFQLTDEALPDKTEDQYCKAVKIIRRKGYVSVSNIQRHCRLAYYPALRLIERMQKEGIVSEPDGRGYRSVLDFDADSGSDPLI